MLSYKLYDLLRSAGLLSKFSADDFICHLKYIHYVYYAAGFGNKPAAMSLFIRDFGRLLSVLSCW